MNACEGIGSGVDLRIGNIPPLIGILHRCIPSADIAPQ